MSDLFNKVKEAMSNKTFCYAKSGKQGFVNISECECFSRGKFCCRAYQDSEKFHSYFDGIKYEEVPMHRGKIIEEIREEFKDSQWYKDNVIE